MLQLAQSVKLIMSDVEEEERVSHDDLILIRRLIYERVPLGEQLRKAQWRQN